MSSTTTKTPTVRMILAIMALTTIAAARIGKTPPRLKIHRTGKGRAGALRMWWRKSPITAATATATARSRTWALRLIGDYPPLQHSFQVAGEDELDFMGNKGGRREEFPLGTLGLTTWTGVSVWVVRSGDLRRRSGFAGVCRNRKGRV